ncbi:MAG TPA: tlde1 domain-containing protein [Roseiarcus sp.]
MQGLEATFDDLSFEGGDSPQRVLPKIVPFGAALALAGAVSVWALHWQGSTLPETVFSLWTTAPTATPAISKPFADIPIDANLLAQLKSPAPAAPSQQVANLEPAAPAFPFPLPRLEAFPPSSPAAPEVASLPLPPGRDAPEIGGETESFPLPPARPPGFGAPTQSTSPERHASRPDTAVARLPAQPDNRNVIEKLLGWAHPSAPGVASTATRAATQPVVAERRQSEPAAAAGGLGRGPLFSFPSLFGNSAPAPVSGYDHYTAVYDISARVVYLPDGTRLEAHSGLGQALDNPRFVAERAVGPTPPHVYELTLRESLFHGVQAIRLTPVGEGGIYGRAGLLAHPFMLGPNGDSNGCVSFKNYDAFLRAYQNGQIKKIAVVAKL